jgi:hypothetical protein
VFREIVRTSKEMEKTAWRRGNKKDPKKSEDGKGRGDIKTNLISGKD